MLTSATDNHAKQAKEQRDNQPANASSHSASFASVVSAIEALTDRGVTHQVFCGECKENRAHEVPGPTERFRNLLEEYAPGASHR